MTNKVNRVPPDGGYGWVVTYAFALSNVAVLTPLTCSNIVFQEAFHYTGLTLAQSHLIVNLNLGVGKLLSVFAGPVLHRFSYRKVAVVGAVLASTGFALTAASSSFWMFVFSFCAVNSIGVAAVMAAFGLAINSFFKEKRGRAFGVGMSLTGLGGIIMPHVISALMYAFGWRSTLLFVSAICLHSLAAACLLRPAKWYLKDPPREEELMIIKKQNAERINQTVTISSDQTNTIQTTEESEKSLLQKFINFFDLTLLTDPIFVNMFVGISIASNIDMSFTLSLPFILRDLMKFETFTIGLIMSTIQFTDTAFRLVSPFLGEWCRSSPRIMYMIGLVLIVFIRTIMLYTTSFTGMIFVALALGIIKGLCTVFMNVVIPNYVPIERLPYASGIQMFVSGITIIVFGYILGIIRESSGSYQMTILFINAVSLFTVLIWSIELLYLRLKNKKDVNKSNPELG